MKDLHFEGLDLYKDDKLQGYIEETNDSKDKFIYWLCPEGVKGINELDLHYYEYTLRDTKKAILADYESEA